MLLFTVSMWSDGQMCAPEIVYLQNGGLFVNVVVAKELVLLCTSLLLEYRPLRPIGSSVALRGDLSSILFIIITSSSRTAVKIILTFLTK